MVVQEKYHAIQWAPFTVNAATKTATYSDDGATAALQGKLDRIYIKQPSVVGSLYVFESGTDTSLFVCSTASGVDIDVYPRVFTVNNVNAALSGTNSTHTTQYTVNNPLYIVGSVFTSGTSNFVSGIVVYLER